MHIFEVMIRITDQSLPFLHSVHMLILMLECGLCTSIMTMSEFGMMYMYREHKTF